MRLTLRYPGDPPATVDLMFGQDFADAAGPRSIRITDFTTGELLEDIPVTEVVCDLCNAGIGPTDPCALQDNSRLYCWPCFLTNLRPYLTGV